MKQSVNVGVGLLVPATLLAGVSLILWPAAMIEAAFGTPLGPDPGLATQAGTWTAIGLVRVVGAFISTFSAMVLAVWTGRGRVLFGAVGSFSLLIAAIQWRATLPFDVGLIATGVTALLVCVGVLALTESERRQVTAA